MADVRSLGYSELFVLSSNDLWNALQQFPEAKTRMIEVGRERLRQAGLLAEMEVMLSVLYIKVKHSVVERGHIHFPIALLIS